jgi:hypothetical protein
MSRMNLAGAYAAANRGTEAVPLAEQALADIERVLGADHPTTLNARSILASASFRVGRLDEAIAAAERVLRDSERVLGPDHPSTRHNRELLARLQSHQTAAAGGATAGGGEPVSPKEFINGGGSILAEGARRRNPEALTQWSQSRRDGS